MGEPLWLQVERPQFSSLAHDVTVDVAIVGAGITGITAAWLLKQEGLRVAVIDKGRVGEGYTGCTTAHLTYVTDLRLAELVKNFGEDHAQAVWDSGQAAIQQIAQIVESENIDCDFNWAPGYVHARWQSNDDERSELEEETRLANVLGFDAFYLDSVPLAERPGIRYGNVAKFHPIKFLMHLAKQIPGNGSHIFEGSAVEEVSDEPLTVHAAGHRVSCRYVILATHVPLMGITGYVSATLLQSKIYPYTSYAIGARLPQGVAQHAMWWDTSDPYNYLRVDKHNGEDYVIFGGKDHKTGQEEHPEYCWQDLEQLLLKILPMARVTDRWSGQVIETNDGLPYIGETADHQFAATGFSGNGLTFGTLAAMMARDSVLERRNPWRDLYSVHRTKLRGGTWDYLKQNIDYPYYMLKDRLRGTEGESADSIKPGEGRILRLAGDRVACYRDEDGNLSQLSPVCPHMGCLVHWNGAESSWDCPCHGSRFKPTGELLAGPAETPLPQWEAKESAAKK